MTPFRSQTRPSWPSLRPLLLLQRRLINPPHLAVRIDDKEACTWIIDPNWDVDQTARKKMSGCHDLPLPPTTFFLFAFHVRNFSAFVLCLYFSAPNLHLSFGQQQSPSNYFFIFDDGGIKEVSVRASTPYSCCLQHPCLVFSLLVMSQLHRQQITCTITDSS